MNILLLEDNDIQLSALKSIVANAFHDYRIYTATCYAEAVTALDSHAIDIFLLDINLNEERSGLDVCEYLRNKSKYEKTPVIFITDISVPNLDVINKYHCSNYFSKPYSDADVIDAINKATKTPEPKDKAIKLKDIFGIFFHLKPSSLTYARVEGHRKHIFTSCGDFIVTNPTFDNLMEEVSLPLVRCHKSYLVNPEFVLSYDRANSYISIYGCDENIPVGRKYKSEIDMYLKGK